MLSGSAAQSARTEQHCRSHVSLTWSDVALLFVQDAEVEGGLHVSPSVCLLLELPGLGDAHVLQHVVEFGGDPLHHADIRKHPTWSLS